MSLGGVLSLLAIAAGAFTSVVLLVPFTRNVALAYRVVAVPKEAKLHSYPIPCLGGIAVALTAIGGSAFLPGWSIQAAVIVLGGGLVAVVGLIDDVRVLSPGPRLLAEAFAGSIVVGAGVRLHVVGGPTDALISVLWLVLVTNAFNLLDNMD